MEEARIDSLYEKAKDFQHRLESKADAYGATRFNGVLCLLMKGGEHSVTIAERLGIKENEVRNRVTLDEPGIGNCTPEDFRYTAEYIEETLRGQITPTNLAAAPLLRLKHLLLKMADEYEASQAAQATFQQQRREKENN